MCQVELKTNKQKTEWDLCMKLPQKTLWLIDLHMDSLMQINLLSLTISTVSFCDSHWKLMRNAAYSSIHMDCEEFISEGTRYK